MSNLGKKKCVMCNRLIHPQGMGGHMKLHNKNIFINDKINNITKVKTEEMTGVVLNKMEGGAIQLEIPNKGKFLVQSLEFVQRGESFYLKLDNENSLLQLTDGEIIEILKKK